MNVAGMIGASMDSIGDKVQKKVKKQVGSIIATGIKSGKIAREAIDGEKFSTYSRTLAGTAGGGVEGMAVGTAGGAVVGGIAGGIDDDETFLEGAARGALIGGGIGAVGGGTSGALHKQGQLIINSINDINTATAKLVGLGQDGINLINNWKNK